MLIDPTGNGVAVGRGDHMSKANAEVTRIAPDRVTIEMKEELGQNKSRMVERVLELHANEPTNELP